MSNLAKNLIVRLLTVSISCGFIFVGIKKFNNFKYSEEHVKGEEYNVRYHDYKRTETDSSIDYQAICVAVINGETVYIDHHKNFDDTREVKQYFKENPKLKVTEYLLDNSYLYVFSDTTFERQLARERYIFWPIIIIGLIIGVLVIAIPNKTK